MPCSTSFILVILQCQPLMPCSTCFSLQIWKYHLPIQYLEWNQYDTLWNVRFFFGIASASASSAINFGALLPCSTFVSWKILKYQSKIHHGIFWWRQMINMHSAWSEYCRFPLCGVSHQHAKHCVEEGYIEKEKNNINKINSFSFTIGIKS